RAPEVQCAGAGRDAGELYVGGRRRDHDGGDVLRLPAVRNGGTPHHSEVTSERPGVMDNEEALRLLERDMDALRNESYVDLARRVDTESREYELVGSSG